MLVALETESGDGQFLMQTATYSYVPLHTGTMKHQLVGS